LKQIHGQQHAALASTLSSSIFRRGNRLFLPSLGILLIMAISVYYQVSDGRYAPAYFSLHDQLSHWWSTSFGLLGASFAIDNIEYPQPEYNPALWTIPVEFAQSLLLFIALLGLARCRIYLRLLLNCLLIGICFRIGVLYTVEFLGGMFIAEITLIQDRLPFSPSSSPTMLPKYELEDKLKSSKCGSTVKENLIKTFWIANMISGLFIASWPNDHVDELWGLRILDAHTPKPYEGQRVWFAFGAFQIVIACTQLSFLQNLFNTPVAQYLGEISYALYLTHNLCLTILEPRFMPLLETSFSKATFWGRHAIWAVGLTIYLPIILMVADLYMRAADKPSVKFARWLEDKCIVAPKKT
jgi:peptidoglycan/LPS O-acetylase OafA/YrhL